MEKIGSFGMEKPLIRFSGSTIPIEKFFPANLTMLFVYTFFFGLSGTIYTEMGLYWYFTLPCAIMSGSILTFLIQYPIKNRKLKAEDRVLPKGDSAAGIEGKTLEPITEDDYGVIEFAWNGEVFRANAVSANYKYISAYERIIILLEENGFYFVESVKEIYDILNDPEEL